MKKQNSKQRSWVVTILAGAIALASYLIAYLLWDSYAGDLASQLVWGGLALANALFFTYSAYTGDKELFLWSILIP